MRNSDFTTESEAQKTKSNNLCLTRGVAVLFVILIKLVKFEFN